MCAMLCADSASPQYNTTALVSVCGWTPCAAASACASAPGWCGTRGRMRERRALQRQQSHACCIGYITADVLMVNGSCGGSRGDVVVASAIFIVKSFVNTTKTASAANLRRDRQPLSII